MCEANAYLSKDGKEELFMENVDVVRPAGDSLFMQDIFGEQRWIKGQIKEMNLVEHRIVIAGD